MDETTALDALKRANFASTAKLDSVWLDEQAFHVPGVHEQALSRIERSFQQLRTGSDTLGEVIAGAAGSGKTHLLGELRRRIRDEGYFIALDLADLNEFWQMAAVGYLHSLERPDPTGKRQLSSVLEGYLRSLDVPDARVAFIEAQKSPSKVVIDNYLVEGRRTHGRVVREFSDVIRALFLLNSADPQVQDIGYTVLQSSVLEEATQYGLYKEPPSPYSVVKGISWISSLSKPTVLVIDQLDPVVSWSHAASSSENSPQASSSGQRASAIIEGLTGGLMQLFDATQRTLTVLSCLNETWQVLLERGLRPAIHRFNDARIISSVQDTELIEGIVARRLEHAYADTGFHPPYPTWPFSQHALASAQGLSPREILRHCHRRIDSMLDAGRTYEIHSLSDASPADPAPIGNIQKRLDSLLSTATTHDLFDPGNEDAVFQQLLIHCLECYVLERQLPEDKTIAIDSDFEGRRPPLHARARYILHDENDREIHECFRSISHTHARAVTARLKAAITSSGIDPDLNLVRSLTIVRNGELSRGPVTKQLIETIEQGGGRVVEIPDDELRFMVAIRQLRLERPPGFEKWLAEEQPLSRLTVFAGLHQRLFGTAQASPRRGQVRDTPQPAKAEAEDRSVGNDFATQADVEGGTPHHLDRADVVVGVSDDSHAPVGIPIDALPKHTVILAGSGSGKTVFIRRIIEEAVRLGIPSIVLDPNNDLSRLGDCWPEAPDGWWDGDDESARDYFSRVEVKIWTPRLSNGRPLALAPIPDFGAVSSDPDEIERAIHMAASTLGPMIGASGSKGHLKQGLLVETLRFFAQTEGKDLKPFITLLSDLPEGVSSIQGAEKMAADMADHLRAAIAKNPLFGSDATPLDPGMLLSASKAGRVALSVINFSGLPNDEDKQALVNQLNMALFSWLKRHPEPVDRPINGLYVIDEAQNFVPSQRSTQSSESTTALISQARKYGLGMVLATQQPKGLHNAVISNCTTHAYGKMNSPAAISAIRELGNAKGAQLSDIGALERGHFYFSTEGLPKPTRIHTPLCLSYHPPNPLSEEEVVQRAKVDIVDCFNL